MDKVKDESLLNHAENIDPVEFNEESFKNLRNACLLGMDIGGSLIKIAYSSSYNVKTSSLKEV